MNRYSHIYKTFFLFLHLARKTYPKHSVPPVENNPVRCLSPANARLGKIPVIRTRVSARWIRSRIFEIPR